MSVYQVLCESLNSGADWDTVGGKGKPIPELCIIMFIIVFQ